MELIDVIDENGNNTGEILTRKDIHKQNKLHWEVVIIVVNNHNEVLIQKRSPNKVSNPNKWSVCSGHVDSGETPIIAAQRELEEEIGLNCEPEDLKMLIEKEINISDFNSNIRNYYWLYSNKKEDDFILQKEEVSEIQWVAIDTIIQELNNDSDKYVIKKDKNYILELLKEKIEKG